MTPALDLFSGPGGWCLGARLIGLLRVAGIELDAWACATRAAAGHHTIRGDVAAFPAAQLAGRLAGLIASPPCSMFSQAGTQAARILLALLAALVEDMFAGRDTRPALRAAMAAELIASGWKPGLPGREQRAAVAVASAALIAEPARYIAAARPEWVAMEQVREALPVFRIYAALLETLGYSTWCGVLNAADYGVPQTRRRAILVASRTRQVARPPATHRDPAAPIDLETCGLPGWVSMYAALGRGATHTPVPTVTAGGVETGGPEWWPTRARRFLASELEAGRWEFRMDAQSKAVRRNLNQPAQTIKAGHSAATEAAWISPEREASRAEPWELGVLQSFPAAYPWVGGKGKKCQQIGNAVPPLLSAAALAEAAGVPALTGTLDLAA